MKASDRTLARPWLLLLALAVTVPGGTVRAETLPIDRLEHVHGLAVDAEQPSRLYLATHSGLFLAAPDGTATRIGGARDDFMAFAADPADPRVLYASGHPPGGGNLGVLESRDRGASWKQVSPGLGGPVDFHAMDVSRADPKVIYGLYRGLQVSRDAGRSWRRAGTPPKDTFDLAASGADPDTVYAATRGGLMVSRDGGGKWAPAYPQPQPATLVQVAAGGRIYAFVYGVGLVAGQEPGVGWELRSAAFGDRYLVHMAVDPENPDLLHAMVDTGALLTSRNGGRNWVPYAGHDRESPTVIAEGRRTYEKLCQACHGAKGEGEKPEEIYARDDYGIVAPPLDDTAHAWHHSDENLAETIQNGSPRNPRMMPFKEVMTAQQTADLVGYLRSLWSVRSLACQGARHMRCMH